ncbi:MAG: hypothetical protein GDA55_02980 [Cellvibrionales bacterium]|nr:hypothetical protein [Cellvibrionales bacterium]
MSSAWDGLEHSLECTELPHYAINHAAPEDAFYTDRHIAGRCVARFLDVCRRHSIDLAEHCFIEPSAGEGCFYDFLPARKLGLDIAPRAAPILQADFLTWQPPTLSKECQYTVIGNPPFGHRGAIALAFIKRAFLFADLVAFILPMSFYSNGKGSNMQRTVALGATLIHNEELPAEAFYWPDTGDTMSVNTVFQVWKKGVGQGVFSDYDISEFADIYTCCSNPDRYCGLGRGREYDCFIASTFYQKIGIVHDFAEVQYNSGIGFILKKRKRDILRLLKRTDWRQYSSGATNHCRHIRMFHIRKLLGENGYGCPLGDGQQSLAWCPPRCKIPP